MLFEMNLDFKLLVRVWDNCSLNHSHFVIERMSYVWVNETRRVKPMNGF